MINFEYKFKKINKLRFRKNERNTIICFIRLSNTFVSFVFSLGTIIARSVPLLYVFIQILGLTSGLGRACQIEGQ